MLLNIFLWSRRGRFPRWWQCPYIGLSYCFPVIVLKLLSPTFLSPMAFPFSRVLRLRFSCLRGSCPLSSGFLPLWLRSLVCIVRPLFSEDLWMKRACRLFSRSAGFSTAYALTRWHSKKRLLLSLDRTFGGGGSTSQISQVTATLVNHKKSEN